MAFMKWFGQQFKFHIVRSTDVEDDSQPEASPICITDRTVNPSSLDESTQSQITASSAKACLGINIPIPSLDLSNGKHSALRAWTSYAGATVVTFLLLFLIVYQFNNFSPSADISPEFRASHLRNVVGFVQKSVFNCTDLGLKGEKLISDKHHYHILPSDQKDICQSKYQQACYRAYTEDKHLPPPKFLASLREYEEYHERCTNGQNITHLGITGDTPEGCKYLVWKAMDGMGNQLLSLVCAFIYSMLTKRAMLIATDSHIERLLCNPFPSSNWVLPPDFPEPHLRTTAKRVVVYLDETLRKVQSKGSCNTISPEEMPSYIAEAPKHLQVYIVCCDQRRDHQFFCPTAQKLFSGVNWMFYHSHEYTMPGLYFVPEFRKQLHDWFPNHDVFKHASRYLLHPNNHLWERITDIYKKHMDGVPKHFGIQVRSWKGDYNPSISKQILRCAVDQQLLPKPLNDQKPALAPSSNETITEPTQTTPDISVLLTSLRSEYSNDLHKQYAEHPNEQSSNVNVFTASSEGYQKTGNPNHDETAVSDIWLLSFTQDLVTTPLSTFGSTASGMAGITPLLFINYGQDKQNEPACGRTNAGGPCFIVYPRNQPCDLDPARESIFDPHEKIQEVKICNFNFPGLGIESH